MPKLWDRTIDAHRKEVREAILDTTSRLVADRGLLSVTMSEIAEETGIGRATLYKYFPDVEAILSAWHERQIQAHLTSLAEVRDGAGGDARSRLETVLEAYALIALESRAHHDTELAALLHRDNKVVHAEHQLRGLVREMILEGVLEGTIRDDVGADELAGYCVYALAGAGAMGSKAAVRRLVAVTMAGLRPDA